MRNLSLTRLVVLFSLLLLNVSLAAAQYCPDADKYSREAGILEMECNFRQSAVAKYNSDIAQVNQILNTPNLPSTVSRKYNSEKNTLNSRLRTAQRSANTVCNSYSNKIKSADAARAKCSNSPTPTPTGTPTPTSTSTVTPTPTPTPTTGGTAYCPLGTYSQTNVLGVIGVCKRGKVYNNGCYYIEEEYHQNVASYNQAIQNPRLAILWSGFSNGMYQINYAYLLAGIPQSACVN